MSTEKSPSDITVTGLFSYPIKSCRAVSHLSATIEATGLSHDREWMLVDTRHVPARFITQRECPGLAAITAWANAVGDLLLSIDNGSVAVTVVRPTNPLRRMRVLVWSSEVFALRADDDAIELFVGATGIDAEHLALVCFERSHKRTCDALYAGATGAHTFFADGYPILVANQASLEDLNSRMARLEPADLPMDRFRPNVVISGLDPWDKDHIDTISINDVVLRLVKP
jgi:uncharacterized protein